SCKAQLKAIGATNFYSPAMYKSFGACVSKASHLTAAQRQALLSAEKQCRGEQAATGATAFDAKYDTKQQHGKQATTSNSSGKGGWARAPVQAWRRTSLTDRYATTSRPATEAPPAVLA